MVSLSRTASSYITIQGHNNNIDRDDVKIVMIHVLIMHVYDDSSFCACLFA